MRSMRGDAALYFTFLTSCFWQRGVTSATVRVIARSNQIKVPSPSTEGAWGVVKSVFCNKVINKKVNKYCVDIPTAPGFRLQIAVHDDTVNFINFEQFFPNISVFHLRYSVSPCPGSCLVCPCLWLHPPAALHCAPGIMMAHCDVWWSLLTNLGKFNDSVYYV